jgi:hypothetical protein
VILKVGDPFVATPEHDLTAGPQIISPATEDRLSCSQQPDVTAGSGSDAVAHKLTTEKLDKAARNIAKIEVYLAARLEWTVEPGSQQAFGALKTSADRIAFTVGQRALASGVETRLGTGSEVEQVPPASFEKEHLQRFASFLGRLDRWFVDHASGGLEKGGRRRLGAIQESLESTRMALARIKLNQEPAEQPADEANDADVPDQASTEPAEKPTSEPKITARPAAPSTAVDDVFSGSREQAEQIAARTPAQIVFTTSDADPMYRWVGSNTVELTPLGKERIQNLFEEQGISYFRYQLEKFADEVKMRIENAPEGHILVVKVRTSGDERKPFLGYVPADTVEPESDA